MKKVLIAVAIVLLIIGCGVIAGIKGDLADIRIGNPALTP